MTEYVTATAGGPERGDWEKTLSPDNWQEIWIGEESMEEEGLIPGSTVHLIVEGNEVKSGN